MPSELASPVLPFRRCTASALHHARLHQSQSFRRSPPSPSSCASLPRPLHRHGAGPRIPSCAPPQSRRSPPRAENPGSVVLPCSYPLQRRREFRSCSAGILAGDFLLVSPCPRGGHHKPKRGFPSPIYAAPAPPEGKGASSSRIAGL